MATRKPLIVNPDASQIQELPNGDSLDGITNVTATGEITAVQPACLLTVPVVFTANGPVDGGDNNKPISFTNTTTNVGCTLTRASDATDTTTGISSITVPSNGTYLISACVTGVNNMGSSDNQNTDQVRFGLAKSGISTFPNAGTYPTFVFGREDSSEFNVSFTLPLTLSANDTLSVHVSHIDSSQAQIDGGYFSIVKLN